MLSISWVSAIVGFAIILVIVWGVVKCLCGRCCLDCLKGEGDAGPDYKDLGKRQQKRKSKKDKLVSIGGQGEDGRETEDEERLDSSTDYDFGEVGDGMLEGGDEKLVGYAFGDIVNPVFEWWRDFGDADGEGDARREDPMHENFCDPRLFINDVKTADDTVDSDFGV